MEEMIMELVTELLKLSVPELEVVKKEWLSGFEDGNVSESVKNLCLTAIDLVVQKKMGGVKRMSKITVKKIKPCDLSKQMIFELNMLYKTELGNFIVLYNNHSETLFVNEKIREEDVKAFADIVEYQGRYINDPNCELSETIDHVFKKYGIDTTRILLDAYSDRKKERENESAKKCAEKIYRLIRSLQSNDDIPDYFHGKEKLIYHVGKLASKDGIRTEENLVGCGTKYSFLIGYFLGIGLIKEKMLEECM